KENTGGEGEIVIWNQAGSTTNHRYVWAPEIHEIKGKWYVFFTTSNSASNVWGIRPALIACGGDGDPFKPENWPAQATYIEAPVGDAAFNNFSLDMTYFENGGKSYVVWAHKPSTSNLRIATVDPDRPWVLTSPSTLLSVPEYTWETGGGDVINEGPAAIKIGGKVFLAYAAASVDARYCIGSLTADENADLLDAAVWEKSPYPILATEDLENQNGPGHNSFTVDEYGNPIIVYHARTPGESPGGNTTNDGGLYDPGRHARIKPVHFAADGSVVFNMTSAEELDPAYKAVKITVTVAAPSGASLYFSLDELKAGDTLTTTAYYNNTGGETVRGRLIVAFYGGRDGPCLRVVTESFTAAAGSTARVVSAVDLPDGAEAQYVKAFLWDDALTPLGEALALAP
ncbi:MAG: family 43 glycosylhydrolase, partial [Oscillospiraceae bacterium]|nr:family 43 glycosylhydrolase [Oscillospiraceae bacterium]